MADFTDTEHRRSQRVLIVIPVEVSWIAEDGTRIRIQAETEVVSTHGALLRTKNNPILPNKVEIIHLKTGFSAVARLVDIYPQDDQGVWRFALELAIPSETFWGRVQA